MPSSSISLYQQQATKLLSRKSIILGIPIAAGSIILFLQWRKRKSLKPKPKSKPKKESDETSRPTNTTSSETPSASAQNGSAAAPDYTDDAPPSYADVTKAPPPHKPAAESATSSPIRPKHTQAEDDGVVLGQFAHAKRPRLGRGRSSEKFQSYAPLIRKTSAEKREDEEKTRIREEEDAAAAAAVAAFSPEPAAAAESLTDIAVAAAEEKGEDVAPDAAVPPAEEEPAQEPASYAAAAAAPPPLHNPFAVQVNGWHHDDEEDTTTKDAGGWGAFRDMRRSSIIATFEIEHSSEPVGLSPGGLHDEYSRRPSMVTTISAEPAIEEGNEDEEELEWRPESRRESATVETTISVGEDAFSGGAVGVETSISGPLSTVVDDEDELAPETPIDEPEPADLDAPPFTPSQDMPPAEVALQRALDAGARDGEEAARTTGPLSSKPVLVAAAAGVPAPQAAVVEEVRDMVTEYERAPLAHLPGMGVPNRA